MPTKEQKVVILGAAGRDFHDFNVAFRDSEAHRVVAFTAAQIPNISDRVYPPALAGPRYPDGVPICGEDELENIIKSEGVDTCVFSYSDVSHEYVMHLASRCLAAGATFSLLGPSAMMLESSTPVIAVCAVRTGSGKSQTTRYVVERLRELGRKPVVIRHPMPYGDLTAQRLQRFETYDALDRYDVTIEEREEYEPHLERGTIVYAGIDYAAILSEAEQDGDVLLWDGGNNDLPFFKPDLHIVVADPHRPGHELRYHPGEANLRMAHVIIVNKTDTARPEDVESVRRNASASNPEATIINGRSPFSVDKPDELRGRRVLAVEDGPSLTHGELKVGAASLAALEHGAKELVDPRPFAVGTILETYEQYPEVGTLLPAMGYGDQQISDLAETIHKSDAEVIAVGTPIDLTRLIEIERPVVKVGYDLVLEEPDILDASLRQVLGS